MEISVNLTYLYSMLWFNLFLDNKLKDIFFFSGISLTIPRGAIRKGSVSLYLAILRDDKDRPNLLGMINFFFISVDIISNLLKFPIFKKVS